MPFTHFDAVRPEDIQTWSIVDKIICLWSLDFAWFFYGMKALSLIIKQTKLEKKFPF